MCFSFLCGLIFFSLKRVKINTWYHWGWDDINYVNWRSLQWSVCIWSTIICYTIGYFECTEEVGRMAILLFSGVGRDHVRFIFYRNSSITLFVSAIYRLLTMLVGYICLRNACHVICIESSSLELPTAHKYMTNINDGNTQWHKSSISN